ncbi:MAG TPA: hypothetical protein EYG60_00775 [Campylobacterales bacterium]|nr:hypothetical protein [Campylobacterales bacterium]
MRNILSLILFSSSLSALLSTSSSYQNIGVIGVVGNLGYLNPIALNTPPKVELNSSFEFDEDTNISIPLIYEDDENDEVAISIVEGGELGNVFIEHGNLIYTPYSNENGTDRLTLEFSDGFGGVVRKKVTFSIRPINDPPYIGEIENIEFTSSPNRIYEVVNLDIYDDDGDSIRVFATSSDSDIVEVETERDSLYLSIKPQQIGEANISVVVQDDKNLSSETGFQVQIYPAPAQIEIEKVKNLLVFNLIRGKNRYQDYITEELNLPDYLYSSNIFWRSSNQRYISDSGVVYQGGGERKIVQLTATIENSGFMGYKSFLLSIPEYISNDIEAVQKAKEYLTFEKIRGENTGQDHIYSELDLPTSWLFDTNISWKIDRNGSDGNITATISKGDYNLTKSFRVRFRDYDIDWLSYRRVLKNNSSRYRVVSDLYLPDRFPDGSVVVWDSSNSEIISTDGKVYRDKLLSDRYVHLTAKWRDKVKDFQFRVLKIGAEEEATSSISIGDRRIKVSSNSGKKVISNSETPPNFVDDRLELGDIVIYSDGVVEVVNEGSRVRIGDISADLNRSSIKTSKYEYISLGNSKIEYRKGSNRILSLGSGSYIEVDKSKTEFQRENLGVKIDRYGEITSYIKENEDRTIPTIRGSFSAGTDIKMERDKITIETPLNRVMEIE